MAHSDPFALAIFVLGFAFGLVAAAIWLYALTPVQTTTLIVAYGLLVQGYAVWKLRHGIGATNTENAELFAIGLPAVAVGTWAGWKLYGKFDERKFRIAVIVLFLLSGSALLVMV